MHFPGWNVFEAVLKKKICRRILEMVYVYVILCLGKNEVSVSIGTE